MTTESEGWLEGREMKDSLPRSIPSHQLPRLMMLRGRTATGNEL